jgi:hypothetical protein
VVVGPLEDGATDRLNQTVRFIWQGLPDARKDLGLGGPGQWYSVKSRSLERPDEFRLIINQSISENE